MVAGDGVAGDVGAVDDAHHAAVVDHGGLLQVPLGQHAGDLAQVVVQVHGDDVLGGDLLHGQRHHRAQGGVEVGVVALNHEGP